MLWMNVVIYALRKELEGFKSLNEMSDSEMRDWQAIRRVIAYFERKEKK